MKTKRHLSLLLVLVLVLSSAVMSFADSNRTLSLEKKDVQLDVTAPVKFEGEETPPLYSENDDVRIIVELKDDPSISYAQNKGVQYASLPEAQKNSLQNNLLSKHEAVKNDFSSRGINMNYAHSFTVTFNGFSGTVKGYEIETIRNHPSVKEVYIATEYKRPEVPNMNTSVDMVGSPAIWGASGYNGEGMVVSIIDSGIDPSHKDFLISEGMEVALTKEKVEELMRAENLLGKYYTEKVPYGYNYFDLNHEIRDLAGDGEHGMHVAGTVAANGDINNGGIKGVAPEAQLLAMKVFSNNPAFASTFEDIYLIAIEESIILGADVINMSLGSPAGFYIAESAMDLAITNARKSGVVFSISAGNDAYSTNGFYPYPYVSNPDYGLVGTPSVSKDSISVASIDNTHQKVDKIAYKIENVEKEAAIMVSSSSIAFKDVFDKEVEYVDGGDGSEEYLKNVKGKIALIVRGGQTPNFVDKIANAMKAGAIGVIVRNGETSADREGYVNMAVPEGLNIPAGFVAYSTGMELLNAEVKKILFLDEEVSVPNTTAGQMSSFTSWGTTPTLELKPEITAPGGAIYSTQNDNKYATMQGTSMAAPHVAGGAALVLEYIKENFDMNIAEHSAFAKALLMNTAVPVVESGTNALGLNFSELYSPRRQGAGLMRIDRAIETPVTVVNKESGEAKVELKDFTDKVFTMTLTAKNHSDKEAKYDIKVDLISDYGYVASLNLMHSGRITGAEVTGDTEVVLAPGQSKDITITVDLTNAKLPGYPSYPLYENVYIEGYIRLVAPTEINEEQQKVEVYPSLVVPFVGFYGDWAGENSPRIIDGMMYFGEDSFFEEAGIVNQDSNYMGWKPIVGYEGSRDRIAISPGTDSENQGVNAILSFLRNARTLEINILDARGKLIRQISKEEWVRKSSVRLGISSLSNNRYWDGKINNQIAEDGQYFYQIKALPHYENAEWQIINIPVAVDTIAPIVKDVELNVEHKTISWSATDVGTGVSYFEVYLNGQLFTYVLAENGVTEYEISLDPYKLPETATIEVVAYDYAQNSHVGTVSKIGEDKANPVIEILSPSQLTIYGRNQINFAGTITDQSEIENANLIIINELGTEEVIPLELDEMGYFSLTKTLEDGLYKVKVTAKDIVGNENHGFAIIIFIDTTAPEIVSTDATVVKSNNIIDLNSKEASYSNMLLGGGRTVIFVEDDIAYAYDSAYLEGDVLVRFNNATEKYVKLADGVFIDANGNLVTEIPAVKYFENIYYADITMGIKDNFGEFMVYVNGSEAYSYDNFNRNRRNQFEGEISFTVDILPGVNTLDILVVDRVGNESNISIDLDDLSLVDENQYIKSISNLEDKVLVKEDYMLPTTVRALLNNGAKVNVPVVWESDEVEIVDGVVNIEEPGFYTFTGTVAEEYYGGYEDISFVLEVVPEPLIDDETIEKIADKLMETYDYLTEAEKDYIRDARERLQDFVETASEDEWDLVIGDLITDEIIAKFGSEEAAREAVKEFTTKVSEIYYTTEKSELIDLLKEFNTDYEGTFRLLFGNDIYASDMYEFLLAAKDEVPNIITSKDLDVFAFGTKEEVLDLIPEIVSEGAEIVKAMPEYAKFSGKLADLGWDVKMLVSHTRKVADVVQPNYNAEIALALAIIRSEAEVEVPEAITAGETKALTLKIMGKDISGFVDWYSLDEDIAVMKDNEITAIAEGTTTIIAHRADRTDLWIVEVEVTVEAAQEDVE